MHYILYVSRPGFYSEAAGGECTIVSYEGKVLDAGSGALRMGVKIGSPLSEAKAVVRSDGRVVPYQADDYQRQRDEWLDQCLAYSDSIESPMPHEAFIDLTGHPRPSETASSLLVQLGRRVTAGLAPSKWVAKLAARDVQPLPRVNGLGVVDAVRDVPGFLRNVPTALLAPVPVPHRERLEFLGYRWVREVAEAPLGVLLGQFGRDAFTIHEAAHGRSADLVVPNYPASSVSARVDFGASLDDSTILDQAVLEVTQTLSSDLCARDVTADELLVSIESESSAPLVSRRKFGKPVQSATPLRVAVQALIQQAKLALPPTALRVTLIGLKKAPRGQRTLLCVASVFERQRACDAALGTLKAAYGGGVVQKAEEIKLPRRELVLRTWKRATGWS